MHCLNSKPVKCVWLIKLKWNMKQELWNTNVHWFNDVNNTLEIHVHLLLFHYQVDSQYSVVEKVCLQVRWESLCLLTSKSNFQTHRWNTIFYLHLELTLNINPREQLHSIQEYQMIPIWNCDCIHTWFRMKSLKQISSQGRCKCQALEYSISITAAKLL